MNIFQFKLILSQDFDILNTLLKEFIYYMGYNVIVITTIILKKES